MVIFEAMLVFYCFLNYSRGGMQILLCILTSKHRIAHAFGMVENNSKHSKIMKKVPISLCALEAHVRRM